MNVIIAGAGEVGGHAAEVLSAGGHNVTVIDRDAERLRLLNETLDLRTLVGHCAHYDVLRDLRYQRNVAFEAGRYQPVDGTHIVFGEDSYTVEADGFRGFFDGLHEMRDNA